MSTKTPTKYEVGQAVRIFDVNGKRLGQPEDGWPGHVTEVGRKLVTVEEDDGWPNPTQYRIETGQKNDNYGHRYIKTPEQSAWDERKRASVAFLHQHGLEVGRKFDLDVTVLEAIADVIREAADDG